MTDVITDNQDAGRYELEIGGDIVFAIYRRENATVVIRHVEAPMHLRGSGAAGRLMEGIVARARAEHLKLRPLCSYAVAWLRRHPEYRDLLA